MILAFIGIPTKGYFIYIIRYFGILMEDFP